MKRAVLIHVTRKEEATRRLAKLLKHNAVEMEVVGIMRVLQPITDRPVDRR